MEKPAGVKLSFGTSDVYDQEIDLLTRLVTKGVGVVFTEEFDLLVKALETRVSSLSNSLKLRSDKGLDCEKVVDELMFGVDLVSDLYSLRNESRVRDTVVRGRIFDALLYFNTLKADTVELVKAKEEGIL